MAQNLARNAIWRILDSVRNRANEEQFSHLTSNESLMKFINDFIDDVADRKLRWRHEEAKIDTSNVATLGKESFDLPEDIKYAGNESIVSINLDGMPPLRYMDSKEWVSAIARQARTTLKTTVTIGATVLNLNSTKNFSDAGVGYIDGDEFEWTGKTDTQLTGVTGIDFGHLAGAVIWGVKGLGVPSFYTIWNKQGILFPAPNSINSSVSVNITYHDRLVYPEDENDVMPIPYISACKEYLMMCVEDRKGKDGIPKYEQRYERKIEGVLRRGRTGMQWNIKTPRLPRDY